MKRKGKTIILRIMYLIIIILALQVAKGAISRLNFSYSFFTRMIVSALQFLTVLAFIFIPLFNAGFRKYFASRLSLLLSGLSFIVFIAVLELLFTFWLRNPSKLPAVLTETYRVYYFMYDQYIIQLDKKACVYDSKLFYTLRPNASAVFSNREFETHVSANSAGVRDDNASLQQPEIICLGDSYTLGWGVEEPETFCHKIEVGSGKKTLNTGISSYGTAREIISLSNFDLSKLQYLVVQYCGNDDGENIPYIKNNFSLPVSSQGVYDSTQKLYLINHQYFPGKHFLIMGQMLLKQQINKIHSFFPVHEFEKIELKDKSVKLFLDILAKAPVDRAKVKILVFQMDPLSRIDGRFAHFADSLINTPNYKSVFGDNIRAIDFKDVFTNGDYFKMDVHLNAQGHTKVADKVLSVMNNWSARH